MKKVCFNTGWVTNTGTSEYAVIVVLCGKLVYWLVKFNRYDKCYDYQTIKIMCQILLKISKSFHNKRHLFYDVTVYKTYHKAYI